MSTGMILLSIIAVIALLITRSQLYWARFDLAQARAAETRLRRDIVRGVPAVVCWDCGETVPYCESTSDTYDAHWCLPCDMGA